MTDLFNVLINAAFIGMLVSLVLQILMVAIKIWKEASKNVDQRIKEASGPILLTMEAVDSSKGIVYLVYDSKRKFITQGMNENEVVTEVIQKFPNRSLVFEKVQHAITTTAS